jgi:hypothetical protein
MPSTSNGYLLINANEMKWIAYVELASEDMH